MVSIKGISTKKEKKKVTIIVPSKIYNIENNNTVSNDWYIEKCKRDYYDIYCCDKLKPGKIYIYSPEITKYGLRHIYYKVKKEYRNPIEIIKKLKLNIVNLFNYRSLINEYNYCCWERPLIDYDTIHKILKYKSFMNPDIVTNNNLFLEDVDDKSKKRERYNIVSAYDILGASEYYIY